MERIEAPTHTHTAAAGIRQLIESGGERFWSPADFSAFSAPAVAKTLSRLTHDGFLDRVSKGLYYRSRPTVFGKSHPSASLLAESTSKQTLHPAGISAANLLGFTTQNAGRPHYATTGEHAPTKLSAMTFKTRRPKARAQLNREEGALLEFLRDRAELSDLPTEETIGRLLSMLRNRERFQRLATASLSEPPRLRAILGALGEQAHQPKGVLDTLRASLNPFSRFDFGKLRSLKHAKSWQAQ